MHDSSSKSETVSDCKKKSSESVVYKYDAEWQSLYPNHSGVFFNHDEALLNKSNKKGLMYSTVEQIYELFEVLGEGSFSKVYRALFKPTGEIIAVKVSYLLPFIYLNR